METTRMSYYMCLLTITKLEMKLIIADFATECWPDQFGSLLTNCRPGSWRKSRITNIRNGCRVWRELRTTQNERGKQRSFSLTESPLRNKHCPHPYPR